MAALVFAGCESSERRAPASVTTDSAGIRIVTTDPSSLHATCRLSEEPILSIGEEGDDDNLWFSRIPSLARLSNGSVAVVDGASNEVRIFDGDGRHLRSIGRAGPGPGEFSSAGGLWVLPGDTLWVADGSPWRYHLFTVDGRFLRTVAEVTPYGNSAQGGVLVTGTSINAHEKSNFRGDFTPDTLLVQAHDAQGNLIRTLARIPTAGSGNTSASRAYNSSLRFSPLFAAEARVDAAGNMVAIGSARELEVRLLDTDLELRRIVRWFEPDRDVTSADLRAWRNSYVDSQGGRNSARWSGFNEAYIADDRPVADVFPAFSRIMLGVDGRLWVRPYPRPGQEPREWMAFHPDGTFFCHLASTQSGFTVREMGADYALGVEEDELGVQTVAMYRLTWD